MKPKKKEAETIYWHPAFFADIQIKLKEDADNLIFENEHQLGKEPMEIDVLIIKKEKDRPVKKNIGRIFKKYNIVEYKGPGDYLSIDDFYKVYGYTCFYKADVPSVNSIPINELTITFVSERYPRKLIRHLKSERNFAVEMTVCSGNDRFGNLFCKRRYLTHPDYCNPKVVRYRKSVDEQSHRQHERDRNGKPVD